MIGIKESARFNNVIVFIKLAVIFLVIGVGFAYVNTANWHPFIPVNTGKFGEFGWSGVLRGAGVIFFAYIGFDAVSTAAQEAKNPQRDMPIGILGSLVRLHDPLHPHGAGHDGDGALLQAQRPGADPRRGGCGRTRRSRGCAMRSRSDRWRDSRRWCS